MGTNFQSYNLYFKFIEEYSSKGFHGIDRNDRIIEELELLTEINDQFFLIADLIEMRFLFCTMRSAKMIGVDHDILSPYHMYQATHPNDIKRIGLGTLNRIKFAQNFLIAEQGFSILSTNIRMKNPDGQYSNLLFQCYTFYSDIPTKTVYQLQVHTNIDWYDKFNDHHHYYVGEDLSKFHYPDQNLLGIVSPYSNREFEIINLLAIGLTSEQVAQKLFLSVHTVNTHRRNILQKSGHTRIQELLIDLSGQGVI